MNITQNPENIDNFVHRCKENNCNRLARKNFAYITDYNSYYSTIKDFTNKHSIFNSMIIVQLDSSAENGYPHTRPPNIICIPSNARFPSLEKTLFHEAVHIHQRKYERLWRDFLNKEGWNPVEKSLIPERWVERIRYNPDTFLTPFWSYENRYVPLPMFSRPHDPVFEEIKVLWYDLKTGILEHNPPLSFINKYGNDVRQSEHPYEIYAVKMETLGPVTETDINRYIGY